MSELGAWSNSSFMGIGLPSGGGSGPWTTALGVIVEVAPGPVRIDQGAAFKWIEFGTTDAFARRQIWHTETSSVFRMGADTADGDAFSADSEGIVIYHPSAGDYLGRMKANRFALTRASDSSLNYFRVDDSTLFYRANPPGGTIWFSIDRATGFVGVRASTSAIGAPMRVSSSLAGDGAIHAGFETDLTITSDGAGAFIPIGAGFTLSILGNSAPLIVLGENSFTTYSSTGAVVAYIALHQADFVLDAGPAVTIGNIPLLVGYTPNPFSGGQLASSVTECRSFVATRLPATATQTVGLENGFYCPNLGSAAGVTDNIGIQIDVQTGASSRNLGGVIQSPLVLGGGAVTNVASTEQLRVEGGMLAGAGAVELLEVKDLGGGVRRVVALVKGALIAAADVPTGDRVLYLAIAAVAPTSDPVGGFVLYVDPADSALKARGPSGTVTTLAAP